MYNAIEMMRLAKGRFSLLWRLAIDKGRKSIRKELMEADIEKYCSDILEAVAFSGEDVNLRFSLHLLSTLCTGIVQLHLKRTELLLHDVKKLTALLSSKLKEDKQRGDDNAEQLGISDVLSEVGRKGKRKDALTLLNIDTSLIDLSNDLDKMAVDSGLKFGADLNVSDIILEEAHRMERDGNVVDDDLGMITPGQWLILEGVMRDSHADGGEVATDANHPSDDHTREALMIAGAEFAVDKAAEVEPPFVLDSAEVTCEGGRRDQIRNHDAQVDNQPVSFVSSANGKQLSPLTLDDLVLDEPDKPERRNIRSKAWVDQETQLSLEFLRACMDDYSDTVRSRDELIIRDPKKQFVHWSQMFDLRPSTTLRLNQTLCELFVGSKRDLIVPALKWDEGVSFSSAAEYRRTGIGDREESSSAKGMEHASFSTRKYSDRSRREVKISEWQVAVEATAAEGDEAKQVGETEEGSAARFFFRKDTRKSSVSVQERERRSTGFWGVFQENERIDAVMLDKTNPDVMGFEKSFSMLDNLNASVKGASPSRNSSTEGQVLAYGQADESKTIEEVYQKILGTVHRKGGDVVMISELLDKGSGRLVAVRTFCSLLWLVKRKLVTAQQDSLLGDIRITIVRRET